MGNKEKTTVKLTTKEKLVEVALKLFAEKGYEGTSTKEICEACEANSAAITYHFGSKEVLLQAVINENIRRDTETIKVALKEPRDEAEFRVRLRMFCETMIDSYNANPHFGTLLATEAPRNSIALKAYKESGEGFTQLLNSFFKHAKSKGFISKKSNEAMIGHFLYCTLVSFRHGGLVEKMHPQFNLNDSKKKEIYLDNLMEILLHGLKGVA